MPLMQCNVSSIMIDLMGLSYEIMCKDTSLQSVLLDMYQTTGSINLVIHKDPARSDGV